MLPSFVFDGCSCGVVDDAEGVGGGGASGGIAVVDVVSGIEGSFVDVLLREMFRDGEFTNGEANGGGRTLWTTLCTGMDGGCRFGNGGIIVGCGPTVCTIGACGRVIEWGGLVIE